MDVVNGLFHHRLARRRGGGGGKGVLDSIILPEFLSLIFRTVLQEMEAFLQSPSKDKETRQWL